MKNLLLPLLLLAATGVAGPVGVYLGYEVGLVEVREHAGRESLHVTLPVPFDTVLNHAWTDTSTVVAETTLNSAPAWLVRHWNSNNGRTVTDTAWESGDTLLRAKLEFFDLSLWANRYRVPFEVGNWWRTGLEGTYYIDINGDSLDDTLTIWADTTSVQAIEDVVVPFDTVRDCYRLMTTFRQSLSLRESVLPIRETSYVRTWEWYKDSLGRVRDSSEVEGDFYVWILIWLPAGSFWATDTGVLLDQYVGVAEPGRPATLPRLVASPNPFRSCTRLHLAPGNRDRVRVFDTSGREVRRLNAGLAEWDGLGSEGQALPSGVYLVRAGPQSTAVLKLE